MNVFAGQEWRGRHGEWACGHKVGGVGELGERHWHTHPAPWKRRAAGKLPRSTGSPARRSVMTRRWGGRLRREGYMCACSGFSSLYRRTLHNSVKQLYPSKSFFHLRNSGSGCFSAEREAKTCSRIGRSRRMSPWVKLVTELVRVRGSTRLQTGHLLRALRRRILVTEPSSN